MVKRQSPSGPPERDLLPSRPMALLARRGSGALIALIAILLPVLAFLQYRWLGELSGLEQLRAQTNIRAATARFSTEFDGYLAGLYSSFLHLDRDAIAGTRVSLTDAMRTLRPEGLVRQLYVIDRQPNGQLASRELDASGREVGSDRWPEWLGAPPAVAPGISGEAALPPALRRTLLDEVPAIVARQSTGGRDRWIVAVLDIDRIVNDLLPAMLAGCIEGGIPVTYDVLVIRDDMPDHVVYRSRPGLARADFHPSNAAMPVFAIHGRDLDIASAQTLMPDAAAHRWRMLIQPQSGALEAAVGAARLRNLAVGIGVLALVAVSVGLLFWSMHRVQRGQREQLELVARISHELRTPLSTITCAGENLADNLVTTAQETQYYGQLIRQEGRRLTKTLGDILLCCRLQARTDTVLTLRPTDVRSVVELALAECEVVASDQGVRIDRAVERGLPAVQGDGLALKVAIKNLLINAVKYGGGEPVRVSARSRRTGGAVDVLIEVEDHGPGIPADELSRIFEPFYRGRLAQNREIEGSGIGLSIVRQVVRLHGGRIRVSSVEPQGTRFTLQFRATAGTAGVPIESAA